MFLNLLYFSPSKRSREAKFSISLYTYAISADMIGRFPAPEAPLTPHFHTSYPMFGFIVSNSLYDAMLLLIIPEGRRPTVTWTGSLVYLLVSRVFPLPSFVSLLGPLPSPVLYLPPPTHRPGERLRGDWLVSRFSMPLKGDSPLYRNLPRLLSRCILSILTMVVPSFRSPQRNISPHAPPPRVKNNSFGSFSTPSMFPLFLFSVAPRTLPFRIALLSEAILLPGQEVPVANPRTHSFFPSLFAFPWLSSPHIFFSPISQSLDRWF